jgi:hypothetical protein
MGAKGVKFMAYSRERILGRQTHLENMRGVTNLLLCLHGWAGHSLIYEHRGKWVNIVSYRFTEKEGRETILQLPYYSDPKSIKT